jgi:hypothetical protein
MTAPLSSRLAMIRWRFDVDLERDNRLFALTYQILPGTTPYTRRYHACRTDPEELSMFADDMQNEIKSGKQLLLLALEDLTTYQPSLF